MRIFRLAVFSLWIPCFGAGSVADVNGFQIPPSATVEQISEPGFDAPHTLLENVRDSSGIVVARILSREVITLEPSLAERQQTAGHVFSGMPHVFTKYSAEITQVLKDAHTAPLQAGGSVFFFQKAGELPWREYLLRANPGVSPLDVEGEYVLFFRWSDPLGGFIVEPYGVFGLKGGRVEGSSDEPFASVMRKQDRQALLASIQDAVKKAHQPPG